MDFTKENLMPHSDVSKLVEEMRGYRLGGLGSVPVTKVYQWADRLEPLARTLSPEAGAELNQCDGCRQGAELRDRLHVDKDGRAFMYCQANRYAHPAKAVPEREIVPLEEVGGQIQPVQRYTHRNDQMHRDPEGTYVKYADIAHPPASQVSDENNLIAIRLRATTKFIRAQPAYRNLLGDADTIDEAAALLAAQGVTK